MRVAAVCGLIAAFATVSPSVAWARAFNFKNESVATYFRGTYGPSAMGLSPYGRSSGASTTGFDKDIKTNYSGEFGLVFATKAIGLRLGAELLMPEHLSDVKGKNAAGGELFNLNTRSSAVIPTAYLDLYLYQTAGSKLFVGAGAGYAYVKMENIYTFTPTGSSTYGLADFVEKAEAEAVSGSVFVGYEVLFADNVTAVLDAGYRHLYVTGLTHLKEATTFQGTVSRGELVYKQDGGVREFDMSGVYVGLAFRFYINI